MLSRSAPHTRRREIDLGFGDAEITEIVATVAATTISNYFNHIAEACLSHALGVAVADPAALLDNGTGELERPRSRRRRGFS